MARLDAGEIELRIEPLAIREVIDSALDTLKHGLANHRVELRLPERLPLVPMDGERIKEVLVHLLDNAAKYSPPPRPFWSAAKCPADTW